jgi:hypothetical protein
MTYTRQSTVRNKWSACAAALLAVVLASCRDTRSTIPQDPGDSAAQARAVPTPAAQVPTNYTIPGLDGARPQRPPRQAHFGTATVVIAELVPPQDDRRIVLGEVVAARPDWRSYESASHLTRYAIGERPFAYLVSVTIGEQHE